MHIARVGQPLRAPPLAAAGRASFDLRAEARERREASGERAPAGTLSSGANGAGDLPGGRLESRPAQLPPQTQLAWKRAAGRTWPGARAASRALEE